MRAIRITPRGSDGGSSPGFGESQTSFGKARSLPNRAVAILGEEASEPCLKVALRAHGSWNALRTDVIETTIGQRAAVAATPSAKLPRERFRSLTHSGLRFCLRSRIQLRHFWSAQRPFLEPCQVRRLVPRAPLKHDVHAIPGGHSGSQLGGRTNEDRRRIYPN